MKRLGFDNENSTELAQAARFRFIDPSSFRVFEDTRGTLEAVTANG